MSCFISLTQSHPLETGSLTESRAKLAAHRAIFLPALPTPMPQRRFQANLPFLYMLGSEHLMLTERAPFPREPYFQLISEAV